ncbi:hypothetical protein HOD96_04250 [Candidatus Falkowbacteria bacterium]|jgi:hypothetical protein|nr:hypothetical protein [Candidatus Falkowbacteria bacterium]MBT4433160.1 hypothetical protein [Candidatus Falkowbacteria bacterium]
MFNFYQKLKSISLKLDEKIKKALLNQSLILKNENLEGKGIIRLSILKITASRLKVFYFGILSFFIDITLNIAEQIIAIFGDPAIAFNLLYNQHQAISCPVPYSQFKKAQRHAKVFSYAGLATIVLILSFSTMITNFLMGPTEKIAAAGYSLVQESWTELSSAIAHHSSGHGSDWFKYSAKDSGIEAGETIALEYPIENWNETTDADFNSYTSKSSNLSIASNSITLLKPDGAKCSGSSECEIGYCCQGTCIARVSLTFGGSSHSTCDCDSINGNVVSVSGGTICKKTGSNLNVPSGWQQAGNWQRYNGSTVGGDSCGQYTTTLTPTSFQDRACNIDDCKGNCYIAWLDSCSESCNPGSWVSPTGQYGHPYQCCARSSSCGECGATGRIELGIY